MSQPSPAGFESVLAEILQRQEEGETLDLEQYCRSFPNLADALREHFADRAAFDRLAPALTPAVAETLPHPSVTAAPAASVGGRFADHDLLAELGRGGMGVVFRACQRHPAREVALKLIRRDRLECLGAVERRQWIERFRREVELVASLDRHQNLVTLYEAGEEDGQPYFTMQLVRGGSLADALGRETDREPRPAVARMVKVARAVDHAHQRGVLHRDLKPANILLDESGEPLVSDFGLARRVADDGSLSAAAIVGTPSYMSPEQARPSLGAVTVRSDVCSLGAVLYELLCGVPPFRGTDPLDTLLQVLEREPVPPRNFNPRVDRDLETVTLKCLRKDPGQRYTSAAALADDLENWLAGRPVTARPVGTAERLWRWCRRNPVPVAAATVVLLTAVTAFVLIAQSRDRAWALAEANGQLATRNETLAIDERTQRSAAERLAGDNAALAKKNADLAADEQRQRKEAERQVIRLGMNRGLQACDRGEVADGVLWLAHALELAVKAEAQDLEQALRSNLAAWHTRLNPVKAALQHESSIYTLAFSPDGSTIATAGRDRTVRLWDAVTGKPRARPLQHAGPVLALTFAPDGRTILTGGSDRTARLWDTVTGEPAGPSLAHDAEVHTVAFADAGRVALTVIDTPRARGAEVRRWDPKTGTAAGPITQQAGTPYGAVAFSPDGQAVLFGTWWKEARLYDTATGKPIGSPLRHEAEVHAVAFSPDGKTALTGSTDATARLWDAATGKPVGQTLRHPSRVTVVAFGPDGRTVLTGSSDGTARLWDGSTGQLLARPLAQGGRVVSAAFSPDGATVLIGSGTSAGGSEEVSAGVGRLWETATGQPIGTPFPHPAPVYRVAFSPDGRTALTANGSQGLQPYDPNFDNTAWLWTVSSPAHGQFLPHEVQVYCVAFSPDGRTAATGSLDGVVQRWNVSTNQPLGPPFKHSSGVTALAFSPDGKTLLAGTLGETARLWKLDGSGARDIPLPHLRVMRVAFSPDGKTALTAGYGARAEGGEVHRWDSATGKPLGEPLRHREPVYAIACSPDGKTLLTGSVDRTAQLWDAGTGKPLGPPLEHKNTIPCVAFSPDGKTALTGSADGTAHFWEASTGKPLGDALQHRGPVIAVAFSPDGNTVLTGSEDGTARLWRAGTGQPLGEPMRHRTKLTAVACSPDGKTVLTATAQGIAQFWDSLSGLTVGPPLRHDGAVKAVAYSPDGKHVLTGSADATARLWRVPAPAGTAKQVVLWTEVSTGLSLDPDQVVRRQSGPSWARRRGQADEQPGWPPPPDDPLDWHRQSAARSEATGQWFAAAWHLERLLNAEPNRTDLLYRRARAWLGLDRGDRALEDLSAVVRLEPKSAAAWHERGQVYLRERQWERAAADFSSAIELSANSAPAFYHRGFAHASLGQWDKASDDLARAVSLPGATVQMWSHHALVCLQREDGDGYRKACARLLALANASPNYSVRAAAVWACALGGEAPPRLGQELPLTARLNDQARKDYLISRALGAGLYRVGSLKEAVEQLTEAASLRQQPSPSVWLLLAMAHRKLKQTDDARRWWDRADAWVREARRRGPNDGTAERVSWEDLPWYERVALDSLHREAEKLLQTDPEGK